MNLTLAVSLQIKHKDAKKFYQAVFPDFEKKGRSDVEMKMYKNKLVFTIRSEDATSVRASINGILLKVKTLEQLDRIKF